MSKYGYRADPFWYNQIPALKIDKRLLGTQFYLSLSVDAIRLYLRFCYAINRTKREYYKFHFEGLYTEMGLNKQQVTDAAEGLQQTGLLIVNIGWDYVEFLLPALEQQPPSNTLPRSNQEE